MKDNKKNKTNLILLVVSITIAVALISAGTYAAWIWRSTTNKDVVFNTSKEIQEYIIYDSGESKFIGNFQPTTKFCESSHLTLSFYKTEEAADTNLAATIYMDINSIGDNIADSSDVYWVITEGNSSISCNNELNTSNIINYGNFKSKSAGNTITLKSGETITTTQKQYTVWIWIKPNENNSILSGETLDVNVWTQIDMLPEAFIVPPGATYTVGHVNEYGTECEYSTTYEAGDIIDFAPSTCDMYTYGDYRYLFNMWFEIGSMVYEEMNGWAVQTLDANKTSYGEILTSINGKDVVSLNSTFDCTWYINDNVTTVPTIPSTIRYMVRTFCGCTNLTGTIEINANPTMYYDTFYDTVSPITITGSSIILEELAETDSNDNVTVLPT